MSKKIHWKPGTMIYPLPAVMVSLGNSPKYYNIITIAWTGTICSNPPMCYISVKPERHSYGTLKEQKEYVINLTNSTIAYQTDWCGVKSGKDYNKFEEMNLTPVPATKVQAPIIKESPVNIECKVKQIVPLGSHDMFISDVIAVHVDEGLLHEETGALRLDKAEMITYSHGFYYLLGKNIGRFGFSVMKKKTKKKRRQRNRTNT
jgi:flavin reductase (DIM6/NTAB) family NADH-FMN oxidoreductase RutF